MTTDFAAVLDVPMAEGNDAGVTTIGDYLQALLVKVWTEQDEFNGKRPFGNSGWDGGLHWALVAAGLVEGYIDQDGYLDECDTAAADALILQTIEHVFSTGQERS